MFGMNFGGIFGENNVEKAKKIAAVGAVVAAEAITPNVTEAQQLPENNNSTINIPTIQFEKKVNTNEIVVPQISFTDSNDVSKSKNPEDIMKEDTENNYLDSQFPNANYHEPTVADDVNQKYTDGIARDAEGKVLPVLTEEERSKMTKYDSHPE